MGVFEKIPSSRSGINVEDLARELKVDARLLSKLEKGKGQ